MSTLHVADLTRCFFYKNASQLIAISKETKEYAMSVFGYEERRITIVNHGVDRAFGELWPSSDIRDHRKRFGLPEDKLLLTLVGSVEPRKGHDILLKAIVKLPEETKRKVHVVLLGSDKSADKRNQKWLERIIGETGTTNMVSHFEYQDSLPFYKISDIFVLPSWLEGFGLVVIEAMLSGCVCIRTDTEGASDQIKHGETGFIFQKGDSCGLSAILKDVIENDGLRKRVSNQGRDYALAHFTSDVMAEKTIEVYRKLKHG